VMKILEDFLLPQEHVIHLEKVISTLKTMMETPCDKDVGQMLAVHGHHCLINSQSNSDPLLKQSSQLWFNLSKHHFQIGDLSLSFICAEKALKLYEIVFGKSHIQVGILLSHLASIYHSLGNLIEGITLKKSLKIFEENFGDNHLEVASISSRLYYFNTSWSGMTNFKGERQLRKALRIQEYHLGKDDWIQSARRQEISFMTQKALMMEWKLNALHSKKFYKLCLRMKKACEFL
jgi:tetratricopeptide (TPR) repeat protein